MGYEGALKNLGLPTLLTAISIILMVWEASWITYYRFFHPLSKVPGPYLASISEFYRFYHNYIRRGALYREFDRLHDKYGRS